MRGEITYSTALCEWGQNLQGECYPFLCLSNIPYVLKNNNYYDINQLSQILSDPRFMNYSIVISNSGHQRVARASKVYPTSWLLNYWNAYECYRPGNHCSNLKIASIDILHSFKLVMCKVLKTDKIEIIDNTTNERIFVHLLMDQFY